MLQLKPNQRIKLTHKLAIIGVSVLLFNSPWSPPGLHSKADAEQLAMAFPAQSLGSGAISGLEDDGSAVSDAPARRGFNLSRMIFKLY